MEIEKKASAFDSQSRYYLLAAIAGLATGYLDVSYVNIAASTIANVFINLLKLVSLPIIFLSIVSTASGMSSVEEIKNIGKKVIKYTLATTIIAASVALILFVVIDPARTSLQHTIVDEISSPQGSYLSFLIQAIPSNIIQPFSENNVVGVLFIAMILSLAILSLPNENRQVLHTFFSSLYAAVMKVTSFVVKLMPIAVWGFVTLFFIDLRSGLDATNLMLYLTCVVAANIIQATVVLPLLLKWKKISPTRTFKGMFPALSIAFFSKSSSAALPMAVACAQDRVKISKKVANFTLPLCTTINMNACAAFILITVLFVSMSNGVTYSTAEMVLWVVISTIAAVGNAGVPMGCYFLSSAFLAAMNVPLNILGIILPFYTLIDMLESAINVWSDSCVAAVVDQELKETVGIKPGETLPQEKIELTKA